jgi:Xaa-Pro dipeptidase
MTENKLDAIVLTGGTSLAYFSGMRWGGSERLFAIVLPVKGETFTVCPAFEEDRARELLATGPFASSDVRTWQEDESPFDRVAHGIKDRGAVFGRIGIEETTKFVFADSIASAAPAMHVVSATPVTAGCRMIKDGHEVALMRLACQVTLKAYEAVYHALADGMTQNQVGSLISAAYGRLGFQGGASVQVGERQDEESLRHRPPRADDGAQDRQAGRSARGDRCRGPQSDRRRRLRPRLQVLQPPARTRHGHGRP